MSTELTAWHGYDRERADAAADCVDDPRDDMPDRDEIVPVGPPADGYLMRSRDPWQAETLTAGTRVFHRSNAHDPEIRANGSGTVLDARRMGDDVEYLIAYDRRGNGWHGSSDVHPVIGGGDDAPF